MKKLMSRFALLILAAGLIWPTATWGQAERIKGKAKDLKKQVESNGAQTNAPAKKPVR